MLIAPACQALDWLCQSVKSGDEEAVQSALVVLNDSLESTLLSQLVWMAGSGDGVYGKPTLGVFQVCGPSPPQTPPPSPMLDVVTWMKLQALVSCWRGVDFCWTQLRMPAMEGTPAIPERYILHEAVIKEAEDIVEFIVAERRSVLVEICPNDQVNTAD